MLHSLCRKILPLNVIGYMGNLSPEEILKRIEGDSKGKTKGNQKSGTNGSKDQSSTLTNASKSNSGRKKSDKKDRQTEKQTAKRSGTIDSDVATLSTKMETIDIEKEKEAVAETVVEPEQTAPETEGGTPKTEATAAPQQQNPGMEESGGGGGGVSAKATAGRTTPAEEGVDDEEQYMSADEGANSNASDDVKSKLQYHTDEQSGASGSRDFISDGANYRADDEEVIPPPVTSEEAEFIPVTARSKKRGGGATAVSAQQQHQPLSAPGTDRRHVYSSSTMDRGTKANIKRGEADRPRRGSVHLPPDGSGNRGSQPLGGGRGNNSPSPVDRKGFQKYSGPSRRVPLLSDYIGDTATMVKGQGNRGNVGGKNHIGGITQPQQQQQQQSTSAIGRKMKYGPPSSLQTSRTTSPDRRSSQPSTGKYAPPAVGNRPSDLTIYPTGSQGSFAKAVLSPSHKSEKKGRSPPLSPPPDSSLDAERKAPEKQAAFTGAAVASGGDGKVAGSSALEASSSAFAPGARSWADIAKKRLPGDAESREAPSQASAGDRSPELRASAKEERSVSAASSASGRTGDTKKPEQGEQKRAVSVEAVGSDSAVKDYSFFFDPNEPTATSAAGLQPDGAGKDEPTKTGDAKPQPTSGGMVLNLQGGRQIVLPEGGTAKTTGPATTLVDSRQWSASIQLMFDRWKDFADEKPALLSYKELMRRKAEAKARAAAEAKQGKKTDEKDSKQNKQ